MTSGAFSGAFLSLFSTVCGGVFFFQGISLCSQYVCTCTIVFYSRESVYCNVEIHVCCTK